MKKFLVVVLVLIAVAAVCVVSCPDKQAHQSAISAVVNSKFRQELADNSSSETVSFIGSVIGSKIIDLVVDNAIEVRNCFVCSLGEIEVQGEKKIISVGVLGHVFTVSEDQFSDYVDDLVK